MSDSPTSELTPADVRQHVYNPTEVQRQAKARFWSSIEGSWRPADSFSQVEIAQLSGSRSFVNWCKDPAFAAWFLNKDTVRHKLAAEAETAVETLFEVMRAERDVKTGVTAAAQVKAAELVLQYAGYRPKDRLEVTAGQADLSKLPPDQLKAVLAQQVRGLLGRLSAAELREVIGDDNLSKINSIDVDPT